MFIFVALSLFLWLGSRGLFSSAQVSGWSQTFNLWTNVDGVWDQGAQTLTVQPRWAGTGKIHRNKWIQLKGILGLEQTTLNKIEFKSGVQFPDNASYFFSKVKTANIVFSDEMNTSNVTNMFAMFQDAKAFDGANIGKWDVSKVINFWNMFYHAIAFNDDLSNWNTQSAIHMQRMFEGTIGLNKVIHFKNVWNLAIASHMFYESSIPSVKLEKTSNIIDMKYMFAGAKVQSVDLDDTSKVTTMQNMFSNAKLFNGGNIKEWNKRGIEFYC